MSAITAGDFRNGLTFEMEGKVYQVIEFQHVKPGKGAAFVRTKMKNVITGTVTEQSFNPTAKFETAYIERKEMQYSYTDGDLYYFMDMETFEMLPINVSQIEDKMGFVKEEDMVKIRRQHGNQHPEARYPRNRCRGQGSAVHQHRRQDQDRYPHGRIPLPRITHPVSDFQKQGATAYGRLSAPRPLFLYPTPSGIAAHKKGQ